MNSGVTSEHWRVRMSRHFPEKLRFWVPDIRVTANDVEGSKQTLSIAQYSGRNAVDIEHLDDLIIRLTEDAQAPLSVLVRSFGNIDSHYLSLSAEDVQVLARRQVSISMSTAAPCRLLRARALFSTHETLPTEAGTCSFSYSIHSADKKQRRTFHDTNVASLLQVLRALSSDCILEGRVYVTVRDVRDWSFILDQALFIELARLQASLEIDCSS
jgi:hypothetical protein